MFLECGGVLTTLSGIIQSPHYPVKTVNKVMCKWVIQAPAGRRVKLDITDIDLYPETMNYDQGLSIFNDAKHQSFISMVNWINQHKIDVVKSSSNTMSVIYWSDMMSTNRGFQARFSTDEASSKTRLYTNFLTYA